MSKIRDLLKKLSKKKSPVADEDRTGDIPADLVEEVGSEQWEEVEAYQTRPSISLIGKFKQKLFAHKSTASPDEPLSPEVSEEPKVSAESQPSISPVESVREAELMPELPSELTSPTREIDMATQEIQLPVIPTENESTQVTEEINLEELGASDHTGEIEEILTEEKANQEAQPGFFARVKEKFKRTPQVQVPSQQVATTDSEEATPAPDYGLTASDLPGQNRFKLFITKVILWGKSLTAKQPQIKNLPSNHWLKKINWQELHNEIFQVKFLNNFHRIFVIFFFIFTTYGIGKIIGLVVNGTRDFRALPKVTDLGIKNPREIKSTHVQQIMKANLFNTIEEKKAQDQKGPAIDTNTICEKATRPSRLPLKLVNTVVLQDSVKSIASVQVRSTNLKEFREKEKIEEMARIDRIERLSVILKNLQDGSCESLSNNFEEKASRSAPISVLSPSASQQFKTQQKAKMPGIENDGNKYKIQKSLVQEKTADLAKLLSQARGIPMTNPDGTISFKVVEIEPGSIFSYLGIENDDVITHINGEPIQNLNEVMGLFSRIQNLDRLNLTVRRGGDEVPLEYSIQ